MTLQVKSKTDLSNHLEEAGDKLVVLEFYGTRCPACKMISGTLEKLAADFAEKAIVLKIEAFENLDLATEYKIMKMPTFYFLKNASKLDHFSGANNRKLKKFFTRFA